ncbi:hypothetical protein [Chitinimonas sp. JJ19]|uniref:hypothetical protein n=1 Tax=Chitinimonas sp. JJ19 TaxID=3109352 RepID=UPI0030018B22
MPQSVYQVIHLYSAAPAKPAWGEPCNGCGVCCAAEPCPVGQRMFGVRQGACPALVWQAQAGRYGCGLLLQPGRYLPYLPTPLHGLARRWLARRIAAGQGCDSDAEVGDQPP